MRGHGGDPEASALMTDAQLLEGNLPWRILEGACAMREGRRSVCEQVVTLVPRVIELLDAHETSAYGRYRLGEFKKRWEIGTRERHG